MIALALIRHGITAWNEDGLIQGRADPPLCEAGRAEVQAWQVPQDWHGARWHVSPLARARETARLLSGAEAVVDSRLIEMDWGTFEGRRLCDLRADAPAEMAANEALGLDFRPPGGESPREVRERFANFAAAFAGDPGAVVAVAHKGVIRAALSLATGWDMRVRPPLRLTRDLALRLLCGENGKIALDQAPIQRLVP